MSESEMKAGLNGTNGAGAPLFDFSKNPFGEMAQSGVARVQERCEKVKALSEDMAHALSDAYASNARGTTDYGLKLIDISRVNTLSAIDFVSHLLDSRSMTDVFTISATEARKAYETAAAQNRELFELTQKLARETGEPIRKHVASALQQAS